MAPQRSKLRGWLLLLIAIIAVLLALVATWVSVPTLPTVPDLDASLQPTLRDPPASTPSPPTQPAQVDPAPVAATAYTPQPTPESWRIGGAHMPECWPRNYKPKPLDPTRRCTAGNRVDLCIVGDPSFHEDVTPEGLDDLLATVEDVLGMKREGRLTVLIYHYQNFWRALEERGLRSSVSGFFDGHVHVQSVISSHTNAIVRHEMLHAVMGPAIGCAPRSVHEGVAEWFDGVLRKNGWTYLLWRGQPAPGGTLDRLITSDDGYQVGLGYAEAGARVHHAVATGGEDALREWLARIQTGALQQPAAAWQDLEEFSDEPVAHTVALKLLGEPWAPDLSERLDRHSIACAPIHTRAQRPGLEVYGAPAQLHQCAVLDRDLDDPSLPKPLARAIADYDALMERLSENALQSKLEQIEQQNAMIQTARSRSGKTSR